MVRFQSLLEFIVAITLLGALAYGNPVGQSSSPQLVGSQSQEGVPPSVAKAPNIQHTSQIHQSGSAPDLHLLNVKDYGATGDGRTLDTKAISRAVEACSHSGGCVLLFPPGRYVTGTFELLSNVTLDLEPGAVLEGSTDVNDYGYLAAYGFGRVYPVNSSGEGFRMGMIIARNATNVSIIGRGTIDGRGDTFMDPHLPHFAGGFNPRLTRQGQAFVKAMQNSRFGPVQPKDDGRGRPGTMIILSHCSNVLIRGVTIRNAPNWTIHFAYCTHAVVSDVRILNSLVIPNDDGIDSIGSRDVHFSSCDIRAGDDDLAIVSSRNVTVTNCSLVSHSSAIRLANTRYGTFSNLTILSNRGIGIFHEKGDISKDLLFTNLVIRTQLITGDWWGKAEPIFISVAAGQKGNDTGYIQNVQFSNVIINSESGILINGAEDSPIVGITLQEVRLHISAPAREIAADVGGNFDLRGAVVRSPDDAIFKHDIPALYARYVNDLNIHGLEVNWDSNLPGYFSSAIECEHFRNLQIEGFEGRQAHLKGNAPAIALSNGSVVSIRDADAAPGTGTFLTAHDIRADGLFVDNDVKNARNVFGGGRPSFRMYANYLPGSAKARQ